jgi:hypothetical protein
MIEFTLPFALESLNVRDRKHWAERSRYKKNMSLEVMAALGGPRYFPIPPFKKVRVTVVRCSAGRLDKDNAVASVKSLLDVLCANSDRHPTGLGIIEDDSDDLLDLVVKQSSARVGHGSTIVRIEPLD